MRSNIKKFVCLLLCFTLCNSVCVFATDNEVRTEEVQVDYRDTKYENGLKLAGICFAYESGQQTLGLYDIWQLAVLDDGAGLNIGAMSANNIAARDLLKYLSENNAVFKSKFEGIEFGTQAFIDKWKQVSEEITPDSKTYAELEVLQREWVYDYFALKNIEEYNEKYSYLLRSPMLIEMVCSRTIHRGNATSFWEKTGITEHMTDEEIVNCVYDYEENNFTCANKEYQANIRKNRFPKERKMILKYAELSDTKSFVGDKDYSSVVDNFTSAISGQIQGNWTEDTKSKMGTYGWTDYFGKSWSMDNKSAIKTNGVTWEDWRQNTKWKVPYYRQCFLGEYGAMDIQLNDISCYNSCHVYMSAYIVSALEGKLINWAEMFSALRATNGVDNNGLFWTASAYPTFNELGIAWVGMNKNGVIIDKGSKGSEFALSLTGTAQDKINAVLDNGGLVGYTGNRDSEFAGSGHFFVITERNDKNQYKVYSTCFVTKDSEWIDWSRLWGENGSLLRRDLNDGSQIYLAYKY